MAKKKTKNPLFKKLLDYKSKFPAKNLILFLVVVVAGFSGFYFKNKFISATVNSSPVWRYKVVKELEKQAGKQVIEMIITKKLIAQEAKKQGIKVTKEEVAEEMKKIEDSLGKNMDAMMEAQGLNKEDLREEIELQKLMEKMVAQDGSEITEEEIDEYIVENVEYLGASPIDEETRGQIREQLKQQKMTESIQTWMKEIKDKAKVVYF